MELTEERYTIMINNTIDKIIDENINKKLEAIELRKVIIRNIIDMNEDRFDTEYQIIKLIEYVDSDLCGLNTYIDMLDNLSNSIMEAFEENN